jgi:hypothetical protein
MTITQLVDINLAGVESQMEEGKFQDNLKKAIIQQAL